MKLHTKKSRNVETKKLSLDVFKEKMVGDIREVKGGLDAATSCIVASYTIVDKCHD